MSVDIHHLALVSEEWWFCDLKPLALRQGTLSRRRQLGALAPGVDLRRGWFLTQIGATDRGGQLDVKIVGGLLRGLSALHNTASDGPLVGKDQATAKPNVRRMECGFPCVPYRHALARRPPRKAWPFVS